MPMFLEDFLSNVMNWNIGTLNVRGIRGQIKRLAVFEFLKRSNFDIVFIQEISFYSFR